MKSLIFSCFAILIISCNSKNLPKKDPIRFWYNTNYSPDPEDTFSTWQLRMNFPDSSDSLLASDLLEVKDTAYYVMVYTNEFHAPIDGDHRIIYVKGFGKVYYNALTWRNFGVLQSNNDSVNRLISLFVAKGLQLTTEQEINGRHSRDKEQVQVFFRAPR